MLASYIGAKSLNQYLGAAITLAYLQARLLKQMARKHQNYFHDNLLSVWESVEFRDSRAVVMSSGKDRRFGDSNR